MTEPGHQLRTIDVGDDGDAWASAGFTVVDNRIGVGNTVVHLVGCDDERGILRVAVDGIDAEIDGMAFGGPSVPPPATADHPNRVTRFDHLVALSPDMDRTTEALTGAGVELRRTRTFSGGRDGSEIRRQAFFWLGDVILELAGSDTSADPGPAMLWGLAFTTDDLDEACAALGDAIGTPREAVQEKRRIATIRIRALHISVPIALMTPHPGPSS